MLLLLKNTKDNERGPVYMDPVLNAVHRHCTPHRLWRYLLGVCDCHVRFLFGTHDDRVGLLIDYPEPLHHLVSQQLHAQYPTLELETLPSSTLDSDSDRDERVWSHELLLWPDLYPIQRHAEYRDETNREFPDPLTPILEAVAADPERGIRTYVEITTTPVSWWRAWRTRRAVQRLSRPDLRHELELSRWYARGIASTIWLIRFVTWMKGLRRRSTPQGVTNQDVTATSSQSHDREADTHAAHHKVTSNLFKTHLRLIVIAPAHCEQQARAKLRRLEAVIATTVKAGLSDFYCSNVQRNNHWPALPTGRGFLLSTEELATLFHPATKSVSAAGLACNDARKPEPPQQLPLASSHPDMVRLGRVQYRERRDVFGIQPVDRRRHTYIPGKTGMGKTTLLRNMILDDIHAGRGVALIDPHGDLADSIARSVPKKRWSDVVLFDPADTEFPVAFQPLDATHMMKPELVPQAVLSTFAHLYASVWGPRMESIFRNGLLAAADIPDPTLLTVFQLLTDDAYRQRHLHHIKNPLVRKFWMEKFPNWNDRFRQQAIEPVLNKLETYLTDSTLRRILGQPRSKLHLRQIMDEGKILIINLSKGNIGEDNARLLGSLLVTRFQQDAMSRSNVPEEQRPDFYLYVDEFQNFATPSFETILSEARKYRLNLTIAHQYLGQLDGENLRIRKAIFGNVGTIISFGLGYEDAQFVSGELREQVLPSDLVQLPKYHAYASLMIDGQTCDPFLMQTLKPSASFQSDENFEALRNTSRSRYATPAAKVDRSLERMLTLA